MRADLSIAARILRLSLRELLRNRVGLALLFLIPGIFLGIVRLTAGALPVPIEVYFQNDVLRLNPPQVDVSIVFVSASVAGFLSAYFALTLFQQDFDYWRHGVFMGLRPVTLLLGRFGFFVLLAAALAVSTTLLVAQWVSLKQAMIALSGYLLISIIYGTAGAIAGSVTRDFLVAVLASALLADIDAAWLQNPVYYTAAERMDLIRWLPAYYPTQLVFSAAFDDRVNWLALRGCAAWALGLFALLLGLLHFKLRGLSGRSHR